MFNLLEMGFLSPRHGLVMGSADKEDIFQIYRSLWKKNRINVPVLKNVH
jgi:hypothetical protein